MKGGREEGETKGGRVRGGVQAVEEEQVLLTAPSSVPMVSSLCVCVCACVCVCVTD